MSPTNVSDNGINPWLFCEEYADVPHRFVMPVPALNCNLTPHHQEFPVVCFVNHFLFCNGKYFILQPTTFCNSHVCFALSEAVKLKALQRIVEIRFTVGSILIWRWSRV